jgi:DNA-binding response OmpR family regulator
MFRVLIVTDDPRSRDRVHAALSFDGNELIDHSEPRSAADRAEEVDADVAVVDLQVGSMGGMAITRDFRAKEDRVPVVLLLDREADTFLAGRSGADAWVTKPFTASALRTAVSDAASVEVP